MFKTDFKMLHHFIIRFFFFIIDLGLLITLKILNVYFSQLI